MLIRLLVVANVLISVSLHFIGTLCSKRSGLGHFLLLISELDAFKVNMKQHLQTLLL